MIASLIGITTQLLIFKLQYGLLVFIPSLGPLRLPFELIQFFLSANFSNSSKGNFLKPHRALVRKKLKQLSLRNLSVILCC